MPVNSTELTQMFEHVLTLSKIDETQSVAILKSHYSHQQTVQAALDAACRLKAKVFILELPSFNHPQAMGNDMTAYCGDTALTGNFAVQQALESVDLIIDTMMLLHSPEQEQILKQEHEFYWPWNPQKFSLVCCPHKKTNIGFKLRKNT